jgi:hypothetical protein
MTITRFNIKTELQKMARGKRTKVDARTLAHCQIVMSAPQPDVRGEIQFLERLFSLVDPRE